MNLDSDLEIEMVEEPEDVRIVREIMEEPADKVVFKVTLKYPVKYLFLETVLSEST